MPPVGQEEHPDWGDGEITEAYGHRVHAFLSGLRSYLLELGIVPKTIKVMAKSMTIMPSLHFEATDASVCHNFLRTYDTSLVPCKSVVYI